MVQVYSGPFPVGFGLYLEVICVFIVRAILRRLCHRDRCCVFTLDLIFLLTVAISTHTSITCLFLGYKMLMLRHKGRYFVVFINISH